MDWTRKVKPVNWVVVFDHMTYVIIDLRGLN